MSNGQTAQSLAYIFAKNSRKKINFPTWNT